MSYSNNIQNSEDKIQAINFAIKEGRFEDALELGNDPSVKDIAEIQSKLLSIYILQEDFDTALKIGNNPKFVDVPSIQSKMIAIAIIQERFDDAIRIGSREVFADNKTIQMQVDNAKHLHSKSNLSFEEFLDKEQFLSMLKTKLYYDKITLEDIKSIEDYPLLSEYQKQLILLAIYEKQKDIKKLSQVVKSYKEKYPDSEQNKVFNTILERAKNKKFRIFDFLFYDNLLNWKMNPELQEQYESEKTDTTLKVQPKRIPIVQPTSPYYRENEKYNDYSYTDITSKNENNSFIDTLKVQKPKGTHADTKKVSNKSKEKKSTTHYDEILKYLNEKRKEIYVALNSEDISTQKIAISQWDKMEILLEKVMKNKNNLEYLDSLYSKIEKLQEYENSKAR